AGIQAMIIILCLLATKYDYLASQHNFILTIFQTTWLKEVRALTSEAKINIHIKLDTGMGRNGLRTETELQNFLNELSITSQIKVTGLYTHFASADHLEVDYYNKQVARFNELAPLVWQTYPKQDLTIHIGNSGASIQHTEDMTAYSRVGVSIYGMYPSHDLKQTAPVKLKPALQLKSEIIHVKQALAHDKISYSSTY